VADAFNRTIRMITTSGIVITVAGQAGALGSADGIGSNARFFNPRGVAVDLVGNVYVADTGNNTIRIGKLASAVAPVLEITFLARQVTLSWPAEAVGFILETTDALPPAGSWSELTAEAVKVGDRLTVTSEVNTTTRFFRLRRL
jgi:DNA-binding beta-propeller fold protein YncE